MAAEINSLKTATKYVLRDIAKQAKALGVGLQNAAPPQESGPSNSTLYLTDIAEVLEKTCHAIDDE